MEEGTESQSGEPADAVPKTPAPDQLCGWYAFQEREVMLQLRDPYYGVRLDKNGAHEIVPAPAGQSGVAALPILMGTLFVHPSGTPSGYMLVLRVPTGGTSFALVTMHPDDVLYCTHIVEPGKIIRPA